MSDEDEFLSGLINSKLPYGEWLEQAYQSVMLKALEYVSEHGLPDKHHFYITFRTEYPGVELPQSLKKKYPEEMTIVLQHQFHNLVVDRKKKLVSVELAFGGVRTKLTIPFTAITGFVDPTVHLVFQFEPDLFDEDVSQEETPQNDENTESQVISLDAFRKKKPKS